MPQEHGFFSDDLLKAVYQCGKVRTPAQFSGDRLPKTVVGQFEKRSSGAKEGVEKVLLPLKYSLSG
jgi:hypothetical protein